MRHNAKLEVLPEEQIEAVCKVLLYTTCALLLSVFDHNCMHLEVIEAEKAAAAEAAAPSTK